MREFDRKAHWENVYELKDASEVSWFQAEPVVSLELIGNCDLDLSDPIIDIGGGASALVDRLLDACIVEIADSKHNDMTDFGPEWLKTSISNIIFEFLLDGCDGTHEFALMHH